MKQLLGAFLFMYILAGTAYAQVMPEGTDYYVEDFKWYITIPDQFAVVEPLEWDRLKNDSEAAVEKTTGEKVVNLAKTVLAFKSSDYNYFESNWQPFDTLRGDYRLSCQAVNQALYETFRTQAPEAKIDTSSTTQMISGLQFQKFVVDMELPNGYALRAYMFSRLFGDREFSVNLFYLDGKQGNLMMNAWLNSTFE